MCMQGDGRWWVVGGGSGAGEIAFTIVGLDSLHVHGIVLIVLIHVVF